MLRLVKSSLDVLLCSLQVSSFQHDILEFFISQLEATDWGKTYVVCISNVLYHKCLMIQNSTRSEPLHDELLIADSLVIRDRELDDAGLDKDEAINHCFRLKYTITFTVPLTIHIEEEFLFSNHRERLEVLDFITFNLQECSQIILVLKHILFEAALKGGFFSAETLHQLLVT